MTDTDSINILLLVAEDTGRHQGCYGEAYAKTPYIDGLATQGVRYTNAFTHCPVCAPSRSSLVTGMYPTSLGTHLMRCRRLDPPRLFTQELQDEGYTCLWPTKTDFNLDPPEGFADTQDLWLETGVLPGGPFLAYWNFGATHESGVWESATDANSFAERTSALPISMRHDPAEAPVPAYLPDDADVRLEVARYHDNLSLQDQQVGRALEVLEASGRADSTIVIYLSDHGRGLPREKRWCYDAGVRLPLIIRIPEGLGVNAPPAGSTCDDLISWVDIAPTLLALTGTPIPSHYQGRVFLGDAQDAGRDFVFGGRDRMDAAFDRVRFARSKRFHYLRNDFPRIPYMQANAYMDRGLSVQALRRARREGRLTSAQAGFMADTKPAEELYDAQADPMMVENLAGLAEYATTLASHRAALEGWTAEVGDLGGTPESELVERGVVNDLLYSNYEPRRQAKDLDEADWLGPRPGILHLQEAEQYQATGRFDAVLPPESSG